MSSSFTPACVRLCALAATAALSVAGLTAPATASAVGPSTSQPGRAAPAPDDDRGRWSVANTRSAGTEILTWTSPVPLMEGDARPEFVANGDLLGYPTLSDDGRSLRLTVDDVPVDVDEVDVVSSGVQLDEPLPSEPASSYVAPPAGAAIAADPGTPGSHPVGRRDYVRRDIEFPGYDHPIEVRGHIVGATDATNAPLVLFLHGRHSVCYDPNNPDRFDNWPCNRPGMQPIPSHLGYDYIQRLLASQGYVTVSISANGINGQDFANRDGGARARSKLVRHHLGRFARRTLPGAWESRVDLGRVVLVGHSRGGEGVDRATQDVPDTAPYTIAGDVLIAPTNFAYTVAPGVRSITVLPYCDGDVFDLQGQIYLERGLDLMRTSRAFHSSVMVMGANHNYFNTEWTPGVAKAPSWDDWFGAPRALCGTKTASRLSAAEQRAVGKAYVAGAVHRLVRPTVATTRMFDGSRVSVPSAGDADVRSHAVAPTRRFIFPRGMKVSGQRRGVAVKCVGYIGVRPHCGNADFGQAPHWLIPPRVREPRQVLDFRWERADAFARLDLLRRLNLSGRSFLDARVAVSPAQGQVNLRVRLVDGSGDAVLLTPVGRGLLRPYPNERQLGRLWGQTLRVGLGSVRGVDLSDVRRIDLVGKSRDGRVFLLDIAGVRR